MTWTIDPLHSSVGFSVKHLAIANVRGRFNDVEATAQLDENGVPQNIAATIQAASIDTGVKDRDNHLRSADFFDVEKFPTIEFLSRSVTPKGNDTYEVKGDLKMHGVTKPVALDLERSEAIKDPYGNLRLAADFTGKINRKEWGLTWNQVLELGSVMVSEEVEITITVQAVTQMEEGATAALV